MARRNPYAQQVADETALRFDPQVAALAQILSQAGSQYRQDIGQSRAAADLIANMAASSQRQLQQPDNPIIALAQQHPATSGAAGVVARNLGLTAQSALANLAQQGPLAAQAASYRNQGLRTQYLGDVAKVQGQGQSLAGQIGTYQSARLGELVADQTKRRQEVADLRRKTAADLQRAGISARTTRRGQDLTQQTARRGQNLSHQDRQAAIDARTNNSTKRPRTGVGSLTQQQEVTYRGEVDAAKGWANILKGGGLTRQEIAQVLRTGRPSQKDANGKAQPAIPKISHDALIGAGLDLALNPTGRLSSKTVDRLHSEIGLHVPGPWRPRKGGRRPSRSGGGGNSIATITQGLSGVA